MQGGDLELPIQELSGEMGNDGFYSEIGCLRSGEKPPEIGASSGT